MGVSVERNLCANYDVEQAILFKKYQNVIKMASIFAFSVVTGFKGNVRVKPSFPNRVPPPP